MEARHGARHLARPLLLTYCLVVAYTTFLPFQFTLDRVHDQLRPPSSFASGSPTILSDLVGNVILFVPIGFLAVFTRRRKNRRTLEAVARAAGQGLLLSLVVELGQWFTPHRDPAVSDVLCNTLGAALGAGSGLILAAPLSASCRNVLDAMGREPSLSCALGLLLLTSVWALVPFDVSLQPRALARSLRTAHWNLFGDLAPVIDLTAWLFFASFAASAIRAMNALRPTRGLRNAWLLLGFVGAWSLLLETLQLALKSRITSLLDVMIALGGGCAGILVGHWIERVRDDGGRRARALLAYGAGLFFLALRPPGTASGVEMVQQRLAVLIPGYLAHFEATLAGVTEFVHAVLLFVPLGYLMMTIMARREILSWPKGAPFLLLMPAVAAVSMSCVTMLAAQSSSLSLVGVFPACVGGVLGASLHGWQMQSG